MLRARITKSLLQARDRPRDHPSQRQARLRVRRAPLGSAQVARHQQRSIGQSQFGWLLFRSRARLGRLPCALLGLVHTELFGLAPTLLL
jgi:hypothetical protein